MITLSTFLPGEAARITGVGADLQRDWRRRGFLPKNPGHARFDSLEVARLMAMGALARTGIGPTETSPFSHTLAAGVLRGALIEPSAWAGDMERLSRLRRALFPESYKSRSEPPLAEFAQMAFLGDSALLGVGSSSGDAPGAFFKWADGSIEFAHNVTARLGAIDLEDTRFSGAIVLMDLLALGLELRKRAGKALASFELADHLLDQAKVSVG